MLIIPAKPARPSWFRIRDHLSQAKEEHQPPELLPLRLLQSLTKPLNHPSHNTQEVPFPNNVAHPTLTVSQINQIDELRPAITPPNLEPLELDQEAQSLRAFESQQAASVEQCDGAVHC